MIQSPISWVGGKRLLRETIISRFPEHDCYCELFAGGLWVFFGKPPSKVEVVNDLNGELINFYLQAQLNPSGFCAMAEKLLVSRRLFKVLLATPPVLLAEMPRAVRFFYLVKASFGAKCSTFGTSPTVRNRFNVETLAERIAPAAERLRGVTIENLDFAHCVEVYDRDTTFFYADPPYWLGPGYYEFEFNPEDHRRLAEALKAAKGKWLVSYNDVPQVRALYKGFKIESLNTSYSLNGKSRKPVGKELLISNY